MPIAHIGLGSNLGDREQQLNMAVQRIRRLPETTVERISRWRETEPVGGPPQSSYLNGVIQLQTGLEPAALLEHLQRIEGVSGRPASRERWGPRTLDLDLLTYGDRVIDQPHLQVPHPRMHQRAFVLIPLAEIDPRWRHPLLQKSALQLLDNAHHPTPG